MRNRPLALPCLKTWPACATACCHRVNPSAVRVAIVAELSITTVMLRTSLPKKESSGRPIPAATERPIVSAIISEIHHRSRSSNVFLFFSLSRRSQSIVDGTTTRWGGGLSQYRKTTVATVAPRRTPIIPGLIPRKII